MKIDIALKSVLMALDSIHVLGKDAETLAGAINVTKSILDAIEKAKEEQYNDNYHEQRKDV